MNVEARARYVICYPNRLGDVGRMGMARGYHLFLLSVIFYIPIYCNSMLLSIADH